MKHLERAKRLLRLHELWASRGRAMELGWEEKMTEGYKDVVQAEKRIAAHKEGIEDAEFVQELLREYINKWEGQA